MSPLLALWLLSKLAPPFDVWDGDMATAFLVLHNKISEDLSKLSAKTGALGRLSARFGADLFPT